MPFSVYPWCNSEGCWAGHAAVGVEVAPTLVPAKPKGKGRTLLWFLCILILVLLLLELF